MLISRKLVIIFKCLISCCFAAVVDTVTVSEVFSKIDPTSDGELLKQDKQYWWKAGTDQLQKNILLSREDNIHVAKNVIIFIGDGMGISTITSARIYKGQRRKDFSGEEYKMVYEDFPNVALVKTYNVDKQVADSAGTATALFSGVKTRYTALGVDATNYITKFNKTTYESGKLEGLMMWAQNAGKHTGIVTTTSITDATPAATYAHSNYRYRQCDTEILEQDKPYLKDIARQLVEEAPGKNFKVILGGGREYLGYSNGAVCTRADGLNLTQKWLNYHKESGPVLVSNSEELRSVSEEAEYLFGTFASKHMNYELLRDKSPKGAPSIVEMTQAALKVLKKSPEGFVLMIEGGLIDKAHHKNYARLALEEASQLDEAISLALRETGPETMILVTADHSHSFTLSGYPQRGNDILGYTLDDDGLNILYPVLSYANGPAFSYHYLPNDSASRYHPWRDYVGDPNRLVDPKYAQPATWGLVDETHGGEDVALFAKGPNANLFRGVIEQNYVAHVVSYSACIGPHASLNSYCGHNHSSGGGRNYYMGQFSRLLFIVCSIVNIIYLST